MEQKSAGVQQSQPEKKNEKKKKNEKYIINIYIVKVGRYKFAR